MNKICKLCGQPFETNSSRQSYCNREIPYSCDICGKPMVIKCNPKSPHVCSRSCASKSSTTKEFVCSICGNKFHPASSRQKYCKRPIIKICDVCGKPYESFCGDIDRKTCGDNACKSEYAHRMFVNHYLSTDRKCAICGKMFHPVNNTQKYCKQFHEINCAVCGKEFTVDTSKQDFAKTCSDVCRYKLVQINTSPDVKAESLKKARETYRSRTGYEYPAQNPKTLQKMQETYYNRTGYMHQSHNAVVRSKSAKTLNRLSKLEEKVESLLSEYNVEYVPHYMLHSEDGKISHEFDIYLPKYKCLIDCDGVYYHSYISDPNGKQVLDYYDEDRLSIIPKDHMFYLVVEGTEEASVKELVEIIKSIDSKTFDYCGHVFNWCRSVGFPYPSYTEYRMDKDFKSLCKYDADVYKPSARLGNSIIQNFHKSIYDAHVGNNPSIKDAWNDDTLLKKVIQNRLIYVNNVNPSKVLRGFNVSKICPRVSIFNPVLTKHIISKYLNEFATIFDPFSGFSGRLLGTVACNKEYIGQDLNEIAVNESNEIINFLGLTNCTVTVKDILSDYGKYECLLTCPPYSRKEIYHNESVFKTCDEWIDEIIKRYDCNKYVFVVDKTDKYKDCIVETIKSTSHFCKTLEYIVVI
jgi:hypothetical protein